MLQQGSQPSSPASWERLRGGQRSEQALRWETGSLQGALTGGYGSGGAVGGLTRRGHLCDWLGEHVWLPRVGPGLGARHNEGSLQLLTESRPWGLIVYRGYCSAREDGLTFYKSDFWQAGFLGWLWARVLFLSLVWSLSVCISVS